MAFDGFVISNLVYELDQTLTQGHIQKIAQPEKDELMLTIKNNRTNHRLVISAGASLPMVYITETNKVSPMTAPNFCMLLRKHLNSAKILSIRQYEFERVIEFKMENLNELGDLTTKYLMVELMGKHSNIIFLDHTRTIIDSIKHISAMVSSVREVLPGKPYFIPNTMNKCNPLTITKDNFHQEICTKEVEISKAIYTTLTGFSPSIAMEICKMAGVDSQKSANTLASDEITRISDAFEKLMYQVHTHDFHPNIIFDGSIPLDFAAFKLEQFEGKEVKEYPSISLVLEHFYSEKAVITRIRQKSVDLRKTVTTLLERNNKKLALQEKQMSDTKKRDKYKVYGELLTTYGYQLVEGAKELSCINYYDNNEIKIPVDPTLSAIENANKYFTKYQKLKRTFEALSIQMEDVHKEGEHLESIVNSLEIARKEEDLSIVKMELVEHGFLKGKALPKGKKQAKTPKSLPLHFVSSDGFDIYVGKNNYQNEELTFKLANGGDWWFHAKNMAGSHVIVQCPGGVEPPIRTFEEAGSLAAYFSKGRGSEKVEIDYTLKKNVKKPSGGKPGFVIYYTNFSLVASSSILSIKSVNPEDQVFLERSFL